MYVTTKSGRKVYTPSAQEDAEITQAAQADPDAQPLTDEEWAAAKPTVRRGRPLSAQALKVPTTIRFDADVLAAIKATGKGWQTRVNDAMRDWVRTHTPR